MKSYISIGRLSETLLLLASIKTYQCKTFTEVDHLTVCYGINKRAAFDFAIQCQWIEENSVGIEFTKHGEDIISSFKGTSISLDLWRIALYDYISVCRPAWSNMIPYGRKEVYLFMTNDEKRCFTEAGLMDSTDDVVVRWWDRVAMLFRDEKQDTIEDIGRDGERRTMAYEESRTNARPHWESLDSNYSGYDIMSKRDKGSEESILIEVKSSQKNLSEAKMIITRNEWDVAVCGYNINRYFFYLWLLGKKERLAIIPAYLMKKHIPNDIGGGRWKETEVPFSLFEDEFIEC